MGWIGTKDQLLHTLRVFGADTSEDGQFLVYGGMIASFLGLDDEYIVDDEAMCRIKGELVAIAYLLAQTSYGRQVRVI